MYCTCSSSAWITGPCSCMVSSGSIPSTPGGPLLGYLDWVCAVRLSVQCPCQIILIPLLSPIPCRKQLWSATSPLRLFCHDFFLFQYRMIRSPHYQMYPSYQAVRIRKLCESQARYSHLMEIRLKFGSACENRVDSGGLHGHMWVTDSGRVIRRPHWNQTPYCKNRLIMSHKLHIKFHVDQMMQSLISIFKCDSNKKGSSHCLSKKTYY